MSDVAKTNYLPMAKIISVLLILIFCVSACKTPKDCRGRRKTAKTAMGGWI
ncbi:MAG: hypothetical protein KA210_08505 [Bacteroidia bacterium]|jgi:hypothetical protein|nr:hypothetical protein [Bacteroidia bacterium]